MKQIEVVAAVIIKDGKVFSTQRGYGEFKGLWEFPGGKIKPNETHHLALKREILEELNANIDIYDYLDTIVYDYETFHLTMHCYVCSLLDQFELLEHSSYRWLNSDELNQVTWLPADISLLPKIETILKKASTR